MKELLEQIKKYLDDRKDYDGVFNDIDMTYSANREAELWNTIEFLAGICERPDDNDMWHEILEYCEEKGLTEWYDQIENYIVNNSIG